jgi:hypothetical protein
VPTFTAPIDPNMVPPYAVDTDPLIARCLRHFASGSQGRNVYLLRSGAVTEVDPDGNVIHWSDVAHTFYGGHVGEPITAAEAALLTAAGYGAYIS